MALEPGTMLGPYEILSLIGAGGMGEVYKARDTRLERIVALKVLHPHLAESADLRERFEREARAIANLQHPNICVLYDIGEQNGIFFLVLEYLDGETVRQRLIKGPLPLEQVLKFATEISDALDKAHRQGFTHRDIKPGNIMLTKAGSKILDFGLAKLKQEAAQPNLPQSQIPTAPSGLTADGQILGTLQYMAPEQMEGKIDEIDGRADIFAFGAVVYESATGKKAFEGKSSASVIGAILHVDPPPMSSLLPMTPPALDRVVKICLAKDPDERWQTARDLCRELKWIKEGGSQAGMPAPLPARRKTRERLAWVAAAILFLTTAITVGLSYLRPPETSAQPVRFFVFPPEHTSFDTAPNFVTVSPDGTKLVFVGVDSSGGYRLWVRPLDSLSAQPLPGTEAANQPFWSPDSRSIAFYAEGKLKRIDLAGGPAQTLLDENLQAGSWNQEGVILIRGGPIRRITSRGGEPVPVTTLDSSRQETFHQWPHFLPDGKHFLYLAVSSDPANDAVYLGSLDSQEKKQILKGRFNVFYAAGYLLFVREGTLMGQAFDVNRFETAGEPFPIAENVQQNPTNGRGAFFVSQTGVLAYGSGAYRDTRLAWVDRSGKELGIIGGERGYFNPELSPDGKFLAAQRLTGTGGGEDVWLLDLARGTSSRFTFDPGADLRPLWSPDGSRIFFESQRSGAWGIYQKNSSGVGSEELLVKLSPPPTVEDLSSDGRFLLFSSEEKGNRDLWGLPLSGDRKPFPVVAGPFTERQAQFSPDGRWLAYSSDESGRRELYVQSFPPGQGKWQVSRQGGFYPRWSRDGKELFFLSPELKLLAAPVRTGASFEAGSPTPLFDVSRRLYGSTSQLLTNRSQYDVAADGQRFLFLFQAEEAAAPITVVLNWTAGLKK